MNYKEIKLKNGVEVFIDLDSKRGRCNNCGELIRWGKTKDNKNIPIDEDNTCHFDSCKPTRKSSLEETIYNEEKNQQALSEL